MVQLRKTGQEDTLADYVARRPRQENNGRHETKTREWW